MGTRALVRGWRGWKGEARGGGRCCRRLMEDLWLRGSDRPKASVPPQANPYDMTRPCTHAYLPSAHSTHAPKRTKTPNPLTPPWPLPRTRRTRRPRQTKIVTTRVTTAFPLSSPSPLLPPATTRTSATMHESRVCWGWRRRYGCIALLSWNSSICSPLHAKVSCHAPHGNGAVALSFRPPFSSA